MLGPVGEFLGSLIATLLIAWRKYARTLKKTTFINNPETLQRQIDENIINTIEKEVHKDE